NAGEEPGAQRIDVLHAEQREVTCPLGRLQLRNVVNKVHQLGPRKRRRVEGQRIVAGVLEVPLHPHGAEQEETDSDRGGELQGIGHGPRVGRSRYEGAGRAPGQAGGLANRVTDGEAHALVGRIGPQVHYASGVAFQIDLERDVARVLVQPRVVALVRGRVVEPRIPQVEER